MEHFYENMRLEITGKCNVGCKYCFASEKNKKPFYESELTLDEIHKVIDESKELGVKKVALIGGEPLLHPDFWSIVGRMSDMEVAVTTNAKLINMLFIETLRQHPQIKEFRISLDGFESHDKIRIGSKSSQVIEAIKLIKKVEGVSVAIQTTLNEQNSGELKELYEVIKENNVDRWRINPIQYESPRFEKNIQDLDFKDFDILVNKIAEVVLLYNKEKPDFELQIDMFYRSGINTLEGLNSELSDHPCEYRLRMICVQADGELIFCPVLRNAFDSGNVTKANSLQEALETDGRFEWEYLEINHTSCKTCKFAKICTTGCRERAWTLLGDVLAPDPLACGIVPRVYDKIVPFLPKEEREAFLSFINPMGGEPLLKGNNLKEMISYYHTNLSNSERTDRQSWKQEVFKND